MLTHEGHLFTPHFFKIYPCLLCFCFEFCNWNFEFEHCSLVPHVIFCDVWIIILSNEFVLLFWISSVFKHTRTCRKNDYLALAYIYLHIHVNLYQIISYCYFKANIYALGQVYEHTCNSHINMLLRMLPLLTYWARKLCREKWS